jgi:hypothetical protein
LLTDFRQLDGKSIVIFRDVKPYIEDFRPYFREVEIQTINSHGAEFYFVMGRGFDYPVYRKEVLTAIKREYYAIPSWLPCGACYFYEKYFPAENPASPR